MSYLGEKPAQTLAAPTSQYFNGDGSTVAFTLNRAVNVAEDLDVFVNNVRQEPGVGKSYTATGTTLTFDAAPSSGTANVYVVYRGLAEVTTRLEHDPNAALAATTGTFSGALTVDVSGATVATFDRATSDGTIIDLQKDGTTAGSIGVLTDRIYLAGANEGIAIDDDLNALIPSEETGAARDNASDLGSSGARWRNVYLGGGVYLGGTGAANYLDDYEEGTWTPTTPSGSWTVESANYVKVGKFVHCDFSLTVTSTVNAVDFGGLPFSSAAYSSGVLGYQNSVAGEVFGVFVQTGTVWNFRIGSTQYGLANSSSVRGAFTYVTNA